MQGYNIIVVYTPDEQQILMCKRRKDPYKGLVNLPGGKIEIGEDGLAAAYRELQEETSITKAQVLLHHLMDFTYYCSDCRVEVYVGRLRAETAVSGEENELFWSDLNHDFFDYTQYAGEGNIGHMLEQVRLYKDTLLT